MRRLERTAAGMPARRSVAQQRVSEARRAIAAAESAIVTAVSSLLLTHVEVDLHPRNAPDSRMLVYVEGHPLSSFEPEYACDPALRTASERDAIAQAFGDGARAERRLTEFYRLARVAEALRVFDRQQADGGVVRLFPSVGPQARAEPRQAA